MRGTGSGGSQSGAVQDCVTREGIFRSSLWILQDVSELLPQLSTLGSPGLVVSAPHPPHPLGGLGMVSNNEISSARGGGVGCWRTVGSQRGSSDSSPADAPWETGAGGLLHEGMREGIVLLS